MKFKKSYVHMVWLSCASVLATSFSLGLSDTQTTENTATKEDSPPAAHGKMVVADFREVAKKAIPAVVSIKVSGKRAGSSILDPWGQSDLLDMLFGGSRMPQPVAGQASGVIVSPNGYILTNSHVVRGMDTILVQMTDGREFQAKVLGDDPKTDLAVLKIDATNLPYLILGNSDDVEVGEPVAAIGNPFGLRGTLTAGVISAKSRNNLDIVQNEDFIQTDAAINEGNSGGGLLRLNSEVIGINSAIATNNSSGFTGIGFAIPSNMAKRVLEEILADGKVSRGFLGVSLQSIDYSLAKAYNLDKVEGALITGVVKNSPADKTGLKVEDIILKYDGRPVQSAASLRNTINMMKPGTKVTLALLRNEKPITKTVEIGEYTDGKPASAPIEANKPNQLGFEVATITPEQAQSLGYEEKGVIITKVYPNSAADIAGLKKGGLITAVNRQKVENVDQFNKALAKTQADRPVLLQINQGDVNLFVSLLVD